MDCRYDGKPPKLTMISQQAMAGSALQKIRISLQRFENSEVIYDTEDKERVCHYFEELMNLVGLESSGGLLNCEQIVNVLKYEY